MPGGRGSGRPRRGVVEDRAVPGLAHAQHHVLAVLDLDDLAADLEPAVAGRRQVAGGVLRIELLDEEVLGVRSGVGEAPGDPAVVPEHHERHPGEGRPDDVAARPGEMGEVPHRRHGEAEVRVVREERLSRRALRARDRPAIRAGKPARGREREPRRCGERAGGGRGGAGRRRPAIRSGGGVDARVGRRPLARRRGGGRRAGELDASRLVLSVGRVEVEDSLRGEELRHPKPHEVARPLACEVEGHHPGPDHGVGLRPRLRLEPDDEELGRKRTVPRLEPRVDPVDVGGDPPPRRGFEVGERRRRPPVETEHPKQPVGPDGGRPQHLGEPPGSDSAVHLHLPQPVLGMDVAEGEEGVLLVAGEDVGDAVAVAHHLHRRGDPVRGSLPVDLRKGAAEPHVAAPRHCRGKDDEGERPPAQPLQKRRHARWMLINSGSSRAAFRIRRAPACRFAGAGGGPTTRETRA